MTEGAQPWGRFKCVSKEPADESDHIYFTEKLTTIGRNPKRCDFVINQLFISSVHCVVQLESVDDAGMPVVKLHDNSRNGVWVNAERIGKGASSPLGNGYTIHFTKPGTTPSGVPPMAFKFELLHDHTSAENGVHDVPENPENTSVNTTLGGDDAFEATQQAGASEVIEVDEAPSPEKKRKRVDNEPAGVSVATQELSAKLKAAEAQAEAAESKVKTITAQMEETMRVKLAAVEQKNMSLMSKLEVATAENLKLKTNLAALEQQLPEAAKKHKLELETQRQELESKLKESTKKFKQKLEAEHYEQRREMSEKMAEYAKENEQLQANIVTKEEELAECEDKLTTLREKVTHLEQQVEKFKETEAKLAKYGTELAAKDKTLAENAKKIDELTGKEKKLVECEKKLATLEEELAVSKKENEELVGLLATAEEKATAAEEKASRAEILASAAVSNSKESTDRRELQSSIAALRSELEEYRTQQKQAGKQEDVVATTTTAAVAVTVSQTSIVKEDGTMSIADGDVEALRARLTAALDLFAQVQALGLRGADLITGTSAQALGDLHLLSAASVESARTTTSVSNAPSAPTEVEAKEVCPEKDEKEDADAQTKSAAAPDAAQPKSPPGKTKKWEKKRANKQAAPLSAVIETDAASTIAALASVDESSAKSSSSDASTAVVNGETPDGDWEMLEEAS